MSTSGLSAWKGKLTVELLLGISSMLLSLGVLTVTMIQTNIARGQQYASVWPYLQGDLHVRAVERGKEVTFTVKNKGIGPALVKQAEVRYRGKTYPDYKSLLQGGRDARFDGTLSASSSFAAGDVLQAGEELELLKMIPDADVAPFNDLFKDSTFALSVVYSDVYGNCWSLTTKRVDPLRRCPD
jgi:hypothetical protein